MLTVFPQRHTPLVVWHGNSLVFHKGTNEAFLLLFLVRAQSRSPYYGMWTDPTAAPPMSGQSSNSTQGSSSGTRTASGKAKEQVFFILLLATGGHVTMYLIFISYGSRRALWGMKLPRDLWWAWYHQYWVCLHLQSALV